MRVMRWTLVLVAIAACGKSDSYTPPPPVPEPPAAKPPPPVVMAPQGDDGSCTLSVTGATTIDETAPATAESKFWMDAVDRPVAGFVVTCKGTKVRLSLVSSPNTAVDYAAKTYSVKGKNPEVSLMGRADKALSDFAGEVKITTFDPTHIAGSIEVSAKQDKGGTVKITGTFDVKCAHSTKCRH
jgi:hypothetical protein